MDVCVDDVKDPHTARLGGAQVRLDIPDGIHDSDVTDVSTRMATSSGRLSLVARYEHRVPRARVPAGGNAGVRALPGREVTLLGGS